MGRPREFDEIKVVDQMTQLFWAKGFEGTSMDDLVKATGLKKGSLYSSFGNKEELFKRALQNYAKGGSRSLSSEESAIGALCRFFGSLIAEAELSMRKRRGCFLFNACLELGNQSGGLSRFVLSLAGKRERAFIEVMEKAKARREIPNRIDVKSAGRRAFATAFTMRELSRFRPDKELLSDIANAFLESIGTHERVE